MPQHVPKCNFNHNKVLRSKALRGQPTKYCQDRADKFCNYLAQGDTYFEAAHKIGVNVVTVYDWQDAHPDFNKSVTRAKARQMHSLIEKCTAEVWDKSNDILYNKNGDPVPNNAAVGRAKVIADWMPKALANLKRNVKLPGFNQCKTCEEMLQHLAKCIEDDTIPPEHLTCAFKFVELKIKSDDMAKLGERLQQLESLINVNQSSAVK